jgi:hypothetical protein
MPYILFKTLIKGLYILTILEVQTSHRQPSAASLLLYIYSV